MRITKLSDPYAINGTSFHNGIVRSSVHEIERVLGIEADRVFDEKVSYEFDLEVNGIPFTIYDWKEWSVSYDGLIDFHIGSHTIEGTREAVKALKGAGLNAMAPEEIEEEYKKNFGWLFK